jgi:cephalosporin hydroxylase
MMRSVHQKVPMTAPSSEAVLDLRMRPERAPSPGERFHHDCLAEIAAQGADLELRALSHAWMHAANARKYSYHFALLGRPIIQYPQDVMALQELIWQIRPRLIIETGIAHGGSLVLSASLMALLDYCDAVDQHRALDPRDPAGRRVVGVDIDIRAHNRAAIYAHPLASRIDLVQGSSVASETVEQVKVLASDRGPVMVILDSNHTHEHVLAELEAYAPLTTLGSYCCVYDTLIEDLDGVTWPGRDWGKGDNPRTAVHAYLRLLASETRMGTDGGPLQLRVDDQLTDKTLISTAPGGFLQRI